MKDYKHILESVKFETDIAALLGKDICAAEIRQQIVQDLGDFFENRDQLAYAASRDILVFEYSFWYRKRSETWFDNGLTSLLQVFRHAKETNASLCFQLSGEAYDELNKATTNAMDIFNLEIDKPTDHLSLFAKSCFREIGDMLEGSLLHYMKYVLQMSLISKGDKSPRGKVESMSFGQITNELLKNPQFADLYQPSPWGIRINQWRNIAQHSKYRPDDSSGLIECEYGEQLNQRRLSMTADDLRSVLTRCHDIGYLHKVAITFFGVDNLSGILEHLSSVPRLTTETIEASVLGSLSLEEFEIQDFAALPDKWAIELVDRRGRTYPELLRALRTATWVYFGTSKEGELKVTVRDETGKAVMQGILRAS